MNSQETPIPTRLQGFPLYKGYLVHFTVWVSDDGTPDFRVVHEANRRECMIRKLCTLCGQTLEQPLVFIGSPKSVENRIFVDGPMHKECAVYAASVCPYLADANYQARSLESSEKKISKSGTSSVYLACIPGRPDKMALYYTDGYLLFQNQGGIYYHSHAPLKVDWNVMPTKCQRKK